MRLSPRALFLAACALLYSPWLFLGYGSDDDAYRIVRTGRVLLEEGRYIGSRNPGYLVPELATAVLDALGGSVASNLGTLALALVALAAFLSVAQRLGVPHRFWLAAGLAVQPVFWTNAAATMDHVWALGFLLAGWAVLLDRRWAIAGLLLGLSVGSRLTLAFGVAGVLAFALWQHRATFGETPLRETLLGGVVRAAVVAGVVGAACYLPSAWEFGWTLGFLEPAGLGGDELWTWTLRLGRWGYKSVYLWGLVPAVFLAGLAVYGLRRLSKGEAEGAWPLVALALGVLLAYEALFLRYPLDVGYLLPTVPFVLLALGAVLADRKRVLVAFVVVLAATNLVSLNVARPDQPFAATGAAVGLWVEPGRLVADTRVRLLARDCETVRCWQERMGMVPEGE